MKAYEASWSENSVRSSIHFFLSSYLDSAFDHEHGADLLFVQVKPAVALVELSAPL